MAILFILIFIGIIGAGGYFFYYILKVQPNQNKANKTSVNMMSIGKAKKNEYKGKTIQDILPFENIQDSVFDLGGNRYRAIIECSSVNYYLMSKDEQDRVEESFRGLVNTFDFAAAFLIQTRDLDIGEIVEITIRDCDHTAYVAPQLKDYAGAYAKYISSITEQGTFKKTTSKVKRKYIIIGSEIKGNRDFNKMSKENRRLNAFNTLENRCRTVLAGLGQCKIEAHVLNTEGLVEVMYHALNQKQGALTEGIVDGSYLASIVSGKELLEKPLEDADIVDIINQAMVKVQSVIQNKTKITEQQEDKLTGLLDELRTMRNRNSNLLASVYESPQKSTKFDTNNAPQRLNQSALQAKNLTITQETDDEWIEI